LKYVSLLVLILQNAALVLVTRYATTRHQTPFLKTVAVFYNEIVKIIVAFVLFFATAGLSKK
jgi:UDP-sugar transporter A1/2/3